MSDSVEQIYETIKDYRNDDGIYITPKHISDWANQFGNDADFILDEFAHIVRQVYVTKEIAYKFLQAVLDVLMKEYKTLDLTQLLQDTSFLRLQAKGKSQQYLLDMLDEVVMQLTNQRLADFDSFPKKHFVYIDDVLASGSTVGNHLVDWLLEGNRYQEVLKKNFDLKVILMCMHTLGYSFQKYRISKVFNVNADRLIDLRCCYKIENNPTDFSPAFNLALPIKEQLSQSALQYFNNLEADEKYAKYGFRKEGTPTNEWFFTSEENRIRYENIIVNKGLDILRATGNIGNYTRPLGLVNPKYKTLGMGTHFFTWRNIPNNCPLVFWWEVSGCSWIPLFPRK